MATNEVTPVSEVRLRKLRGVRSVSPTRMSCTTRDRLQRRGCHRAAANLKVLNLGHFSASRGCYSPSDIVESESEFGANCGPAAFSAVVRSPVRVMMGHFPHFPDRSWTTVGDMRSALRSANVDYLDGAKGLPDFGLALLQLRVNTRPLHPLYSLATTHWVAVVENFFYDVNWRGWLPISLWESVLLPQFRFGSKSVVGWEVRNSLVVLCGECREKLELKEQITAGR